MAAAATRAPRALAPQPQRVARRVAVARGRVVQQRAAPPAVVLRAAGRARARAPTAASSDAAAVPAPAPRARSADVLFSTDLRPIILFDGVCNMCNGGVNFALDYDPQGFFRFAALQSEVGRALLVRAGRRPDDISSIVLVEPDRAYTKSEAVLRIARRLSDRVGALPLLGAAGLLAPGALRDAVYDVVAANRYRVFGRAEACRVSDARFEQRFVPDSALREANGTARL